MTGSSLTENTFIRDIPEVLKRRLYAKLDIHNNWERLAEQIPRRHETIFHCKPLDSEFDPRYTSVSIDGFQRAGNKSGGSATKSLLREWGTKNSQVKHLILALKRAELIEPAKALEQQLSTTDQGSLHQSAEQTNQQSAISDISNLAISSQITTTCSSTQPALANRETDVPLTTANTDRIDIHISGGDRPVSVKEPPAEELDTGYPVAPDFSQFQQKIDFSVLEKITDNFDCRHYQDGGRVIGEGGFGDVYLGMYSDKCKVAIKRLKQGTDEITQEQKLENLTQFETEVEILSKYKHENVVLLLGYSVQDDIHCLVYQYMENGSLEERLAQRFKTPPLSIELRLEIIKGTARGIAFLNESGLVHRDIKSANILLDSQFVPKIGDFATAKVVPVSALNKTIELQVSKVIGTAAYLAPEAISFVVNPKLDSFSFGVVLLEVLTGLPVIDENRKYSFLRVYVQEFCYIPEDDDDDIDEDEPSGTIFDLVDNCVEVWDKTLVREMYALSERCLEHNYRRRPKVVDILPNLEKLSYQ